MNSGSPRPNAGLLLGLDNGTQSCTAAVFTTRGRLVKSGRAPQRVFTPREGWAEQDPDEWWRSARRAIRQAISGIDPKRLLALGVAFQRETFTLVDRRGRFVRRAMLWLDIRASREARRLGRRFGAAHFHRLTGKPLDVTCALPRLLWLSGNGVSLRNKGWLDVGTELARKLTGRPVTCASGADTCGLIGLASRTWLKDHLKAVGMGNSPLPDLAEPGEEIGRVSPEAARQTGLPRGLPVVAAGGDGQVFSVGVGAVGAGALSLSLGTSVVLGASWPKPLISPFFRTLLGFPGSYLLESVLQSGTYLLRWFLDNAGTGKGDEDTWERKALRLPPGSAGLVTLPHWWGVRFPESLPLARGATLGWGNLHTFPHFYRSLVEGSAFELRRLLLEFRRRVPALAKAVHAGGGGMRGQLWGRVLADAMERPVRPAALKESTALGAAIFAGLGAGTFPDLPSACAAMCRTSPAISPRPDAAAAYREIFLRIYEPFCRLASPLSVRLSGLCED